MTASTSFVTGSFSKSREDFGFPSSTKQPGKVAVKSVGLPSPAVEWGERHVCD